MKGRNRKRLEWKGGRKEHKHRKDVCGCNGKVRERRKDGRKVDKGRRGKKEGRLVEERR